MADELKCPLCDWVPELVHRIDHPSLEFLLAEHLMGVHRPSHESRWEWSCFCGHKMTGHIWVVMSHFKQYGGVVEHFRAWQLGID